MRVSRQMKHFLSSMEYPARPEDLIREALRDGFTDDDVLPLAMLDERSYGGGTEVSRSLADGNLGVSYAI